VLIGLAAVLAAPPALAKAGRWQVTVGLRISNPTGAPFNLRLALPPNGDGQRLGSLEVKARGLSSEILLNRDDPQLRLSGKLKGARRVAVRYTVQRHRSAAPLPVIAPPNPVPLELRPYLAPSPLFQSRSLLARDFLATNVSPLLEVPSADLVRAIFHAVREHLEIAPEGKTLALDILRAGGGRRIGIERVFTTLLRAAGVPARFVEGLNLDSATQRKRVFWTEVWDGAQWWAISASGDWSGRPPKNHLVLTRDGRRVLEVEGDVTASYVVTVRPIEGST
jgi:transglutaminase-like putative cysteine protease